MISRFSFLFFFVGCHLSIDNLCNGFWDNGHMLVGEVATQYMLKKDVSTINSILATWEKDFPNTGEITTATTFPDILKCKTKAANCQAMLPSVSSMEDWHYITNYFDPQTNVSKNATSELLPAGKALDILSDTINTVSTSNSIWALNFMLRNFVHIFGDLHQPLHTTSLVNSHHPQGDMGGNLFQFKHPCPFINLHALWDSVGGKYTKNWGLYIPDVRNSLRQNGTQIIKKYKKDFRDPLHFSSLSGKGISYMKQSIAQQHLFAKMIRDSHDLAKANVYQGIDLNMEKYFIACPNQEYMKKVQAIAERQIHLAGYRLAIVLTEIARHVENLVHKHNNC